jgi:hypothetical protein
MRGNDAALKLCGEHYMSARNTMGLLSVLAAARCKSEHNAIELAQRIASKVECPECGKRVTPAGLQMHAQVSHAGSEVDVAGALRAFEERRAAASSEDDASAGRQPLIDDGPGF